MQRNPPKDSRFSLSESKKKRDRSPSTPDTSKLLRSEEGKVSRANSVADNLITPDAVMPDSKVDISALDSSSSVGSTEPQSSSSVSEVVVKPRANSPIGRAASELTFNRPPPSPPKLTHSTSNIQLHQSLAFNVQNVRLLLIAMYNYLFTIRSRLVMHPDYQQKIFSHLPENKSLLTLLNQNLNMLDELLSQDLDVTLKRVIQQKFIQKEATAKLNSDNALFVISELLQYRLNDSKHLIAETLVSKRGLMPIEAKFKLPLRDVLTKLYGQYNANEIPAAAKGYMNGYRYYAQGQNLCSDKVTDMFYGKVQLGEPPALAPKGVHLYVITTRQPECVAADLLGSVYELRGVFMKPGSTGHPHIIETSIDRPVCAGEMYVQHYESENKLSAHVVFANDKTGSFYSETNESSFEPELKQFFADHSIDYARFAQRPLTDFKKDNDNTGFDTAKFDAYNNQMLTAKLSHLQLESYAVTDQSVAAKRALAESGSVATSAFALMSPSIQPVSRADKEEEALIPEPKSPKK